MQGKLSRLEIFTSYRRNGQSSCVKNEEPYNEPKPLHVTISWLFAFPSFSEPLYHYMHCCLCYWFFSTRALHLRFEKGMVGLSFCDFVGTREEKAMMAAYRQKEWPRRYKVLNKIKKNKFKSYASSSCKR